MLKDLKKYLEEDFPKDQNTKLGLIKGQGKDFKRLIDKYFEPGSDKDLIEHCLERIRKFVEHRVTNFNSYGADLVKNAKLAIVWDTDNLCKTETSPDNPYKCLECWLASFFMLAFLPRKAL